MARVAIVTDSTANLTPEWVQARGVTVVPLYVLFGDESYQDGVDLTAREFYQKMATSPVLPTTSQPSSGLFVEAFERLFKDGYDEILAVLMSSRISGTYQSAMAAREMVGGSITCIDSRMTEFALGIQVMEAARLLDEGVSIKDVITHLETVRDHTTAVIVVEDLVHVRRSGRIGGAAAALGSLLQLKPIITLQDGLVEVREKVRTTKKAHEAILSYLFADAEHAALGEVAVIHTGALHLAEPFRDRILERFPSVNLRVMDIGPIIGVHAGPNSVGLIYRTL